MSNITPLIFTSMGNVPIDSLEYFKEWEITEDYIQFTETYKSDGEVVKQSVHVYIKAPLPIGAEQASF